MAIVSEEQVTKVLRQYNPWWRLPSSVREESKPYKRTAYYEAMRTICHKSIRRFAVLSGARRVGKTTIMFQMMDVLLEKGIDAKNVMYVSFDNPILKLVSVEKVLEIYERLYPLNGLKYIFLDEIQYTENWELWMKVIYDLRKDIMITATGSASPLIEKSSADSGTGRWSVLKIPTLSFYEYCKLLDLEEPIVSEKIRIQNLKNETESRLGDLMEQFRPLEAHFNRYMMIGGFPELVMSNDDFYACRMLREDVVDKVIKRDVLTLFNIRNPLLMEKLFLYLCINSADIFNATTAAKELENVTVSTVENYISALEMSNLIYVSKPMNVGSKGALKGRPKIYIADAAIFNAVMMTDDPISDENEMGKMVETMVFKHIVSFYQGIPAQVGYFRKLKNNQKEVDVVIDLPKEKILCEVKYRNNTHILKKDAIIELCTDDNANVTDAFIITRRTDDVGFTGHDLRIPVLRIPAIAFTYLLGREEALRAESESGCMQK